MKDDYTFSGSKRFGELQPMSNLDARLKEIVPSWGDDNGTEQEEMIAQIKQALADEGYRYVSQSEEQVISQYVDNELMTGQEWYDRFLQELESYIERTNAKSDMTEAIIAARGAAGLI